MELKQELPCRKMNGKECSFEFKTFVIEQINNGQISVNFAAKKYNLSRTTLDYWRKKLSNYESKQVNMSLEKENSKKIVGYCVDDNMRVNGSKQEPGK